MFELTADSIGWIGNLFFLLGAIFLARRNICGFISNIFGNTLYLIQGAILGIKSLETISVILVIINIYGIFKWRQRSNV